jgi:hypothetical protein
MEDLLRRTLGERVEMQTMLSGDLWPALTDGNQLENAILNLAINARDAMPDGGRLTIETRNTQLDVDYAPCVRQVAAYIGSGPRGRWTKVDGSIQSEVQRARGRAIVAAGEFAGGSGFTDGWDQRWDAGALAGGSWPNLLVMRRGTGRRRPGWRR